MTEQINLNRIADACEEIAKKGGSGGGGSGMKELVSVTIKDGDTKELRDEAVTSLCNTLAELTYDELLRTKLVLGQYGERTFDGMTEIYTQMILSLSCTSIDLSNISNGVFATIGFTGTEYRAPEYADHIVVTTEFDFSRNFLDEEDVSFYTMKYKSFIPDGENKVEYSETIYSNDTERHPTAYFLPGGTYTLYLC